MITWVEIQSLLSRINSMLSTMGASIISYDSESSSEQSYIDGMIDGVPVVALKSLYISLLTCKDIAEYTKQLVKEAAENAQSDTSENEEE